MKPFLALIIALSCATFVSAKLDADMFGAEGSELLKELKDAGVIDQFEKELEKMLHENGGDVKETLDNLLGQKKKPLSPVEEFVQSYVQEKEIVLDARIIQHLSSLPVSEEGEAKHFVHLTQVLDKIFELAKMDDAEIDKKVLDIIKRVQSLPVMKTSLNKLKAEPPAQPEKAAEDKQAKTDELFDAGLVPKITDFIRNMKKKPEFILDVVLPLLQEQGLIGEEVVSMAKLYGRTIVKTEGWGTFVDGAAEFVEMFARSPSGLKMISLIPEMMNADNKEDLMQIFTTEAERSWEEFISKVENSDSVDKMATGFAYGIVSGIDAVQGLLKDEMKIMFANTFLISQGLPAIKPRKLTESLFDLVNQCIQLFTTWKIDLEPYKAEAVKHVSMIEKEYVSGSEYFKLDINERYILVARFIRENMVEPFQYLWSIRQQLVNHPEGHKCVESLLCHLNSHMKKEGAIKSEVTKLFSLAASFFWTYGEELNNVPDKWKLYQAIWNGHKPETDCSVQYTPTGKENICHILPWQSGMMSLNFDHTEL